MPRLLLRTLGIIAAFLVCLFASAGLVSLVTGCGYPANLDPTVYWDQTPAQAAEASRLHARDLASGKGAHHYILPTGSMRPLIDDGDYITVDGGVSYSALKAGQVITYVPEWNPSLLVCHRLQVKDSYGWVLSGDSVRPQIDASGRDRVSEASYRVTEANYRGLVVGVYTTRAKR